MTAENAAANWSAQARALAPGVLVVFTAAAAAQFMYEHYGAPATVFALLIGIALNFLSEGEKCQPGIEFVSKPVLKIGVALLGARVTFEQIASLGVKPLLLIPALIVLTIASGVVFAKLFGRSRAFGLLTGGAVAICGASAALALSAVMASDDRLRRDTIFTVIAVTTLSTIAMVAYPILFSAMHLTDVEIGVLIGATIHDVAQVVGAGYSVSDDAGDAATYVKLLRVACLPVVVVVFAVALRAKNGGAAGAPIPMFAIGFALLLLANSFGLIPAPLRDGMEVTSRWLLVAAIAALGMQTSLKLMFELGPRHVGVVLAETALLAAVAVAVVKLF